MITTIIVAIITAGFFYIIGYWIGYKDMAKDMPHLKETLKKIDEKSRKLYKQQNELYEYKKNAQKSYRKGIKNLVDFQRKDK